MATPSNLSRQSLIEIQSLIDQKNYKEAIGKIDEALYKNQNDLTALFQFGEVLLKNDNIGLAYNIYKQLSVLAPNRTEVWNNLGRCLQTHDRSDEAREHFLKALELAPDSAAAMVNIAVLDLNEGRHKEAIEYARKALQLDPKSAAAMDAMAMAKFHIRDWSGWDQWLKSEGASRTLRQYKVPGESEWMGEPNKTVVIYREQGIGDEIFFGSCLQEAIDVSKKVIIDCDKRLVNLFKRSFPKADVYGTGYGKEIDWPHRYDIDASAPIGRIPMFFRRKDSDFPGTPYLKADPEKKRSIRERLDKLGPGLKIGLAWTGGKRVDSVTKADAEYRSFKFDDWKSLLHPGHHYISLEYRNTDAPINVWPDITQSQDYDDTAALVDELDFIIAVPTTVVHLAGALGKTCYCITPEFPNWRFGVSGEDMIWHKSVKLFRGEDRIEKLKNHLEKNHYQSSKSWTVKFPEMKILTAVYDLAVSPPTYDFLSFLAEAERARKAGGYDYIDVVFMPGPKGGFRNDNLPPSIEAREGMLHRVCVSACRLLPSVRNVTVRKDRTHVQSDVFPKDWNVNTPVSRYGTTYLRNGGPILTATKSAKDIIKERFTRPYVTITVRQSGYWPERNTTLAEWGHVANEIERMGYHIVWVPDTNGEQIGFSPAAFDIDLRLALYEGALCNFAVSNGPCALLYLSNSPYLVFKMVVDSCPSTTAKFLASHGLNVGDQMNNRGRIVWEDDRAEVILSAFKDFMNQPRAACQ